MKNKHMPLAAGARRSLAAGRCAMPGPPARNGARGRALAAGAPAVGANGLGFARILGGYEVTGFGRMAVPVGCSVAIPASHGGLPVVAIREMAFFNSGLAGVTIPSSVAIIGERAFASNRLSVVSIPGSVAVIGARAFERNELIGATIGSGVIFVEEGAFARNRLASVLIPESAVLLGNSAFAHNEIADAAIGGGIASIADLAFEANPLSQITIPANVNIGCGQAMGARGRAFRDFYYGNMRRAGTYAFDGGRWAGP